LLGEGMRREGRHGASEQRCRGREPGFKRSGDHDPVDERGCRVLQRFRCSCGVGRSGKGTGKVRGKEGWKRAEVLGG
jgi:hypothetical protein